MYRSPFGRCFSTTPAFELVLVVPDAVQIVPSVGMTLRDVAWDLLRGMMITDLGVVVVVVVVSRIFSFSSSSTSLVFSFLLVDISGIWLENNRVSGISPFSSMIPKNGSRVLKLVVFLKLQQEMDTPEHLRRLLCNIRQLIWSIFFFLFLSLELERERR